MYEGKIVARIKNIVCVYLIFTFYLTIFSRASSGMDLIRTEWLKG